MSTQVHETAVIAAGAKLGSDVQIGPYCVVENDVVLGDGCQLSPHVHILGRTQIGGQTHIGTGSVIGGEPQDVKYHGEPTSTVIGARGRFHEHVTVHRATQEGSTVIGDDVMLMAGSHVGHNATICDSAILVNGSLVGGHAVVGVRAMLSGNAAVHQFCRVGRLTLVGGACMVTKDAPPFSIVGGSYPVRWRGPNRVGLSRAGCDSDTRDAIRRALAQYFLSGVPRSKVAAELQESPVEEVRELAEFALQSKRGLCSGPARGTPS